jgi:hypothetical protein
MTTPTEWQKNTITLGEMVRRLETVRLNNGGHHDIPMRLHMLGGGGKLVSFEIDLTKAMCCVEDDGTLVIDLKGRMAANWRAQPESAPGEAGGAP